jgi:hypothetical protein
MDFNSAKGNVNGWRFCALMDAQKETVKPANGNNKTAQKNVDEMEQIINSLPSGTYYLAVRNSPAAKWTYFPFDIGEDKPVKNLSESFDPSSYNHDLYAKNVELAVRNKELETLNKILEDKCAEYLSTIDELEREISESDPEQMSGSGSSVLETVLLSALPQILEKFTNNGSEVQADEVQHDPADAGSAE